MHRDHRKIASQLNPLPSAIGGKVRAKFRASEQKICIHWILDECQHRTVFRQISGDRCPRFALVTTLEQVLMEIAVLVIVKRRVDSIHFEARRGDARDERPIWY